MSKVTEKYQITLPIAVRKELGIVPGTEVDIVKEGQRYLLVANPIDSLKNKWRGKFKGKQTGEEYLEMVRGHIA